MQMRIECRICGSLHTECFETLLYKTHSSPSLKESILCCPSPSVPISFPNGRGLIRNWCLANVDNWFIDKFCLPKTGSSWVWNHNFYIVPCLQGVLDLPSVGDESLILSPTEARFISNQTRYFWYPALTELGSYRKYLFFTAQVGFWIFCSCYLLK